MGVNWISVMRSSEGGDQSCVDGSELNWSCVCGSELD